MLIIAIPKSASTSLMDTLGKLHKKPAYQKSKLVERHPVSTEFKFIHKYHRDMKEIDENLVKKWESDKDFYKQHILPTINNMELLKNTKKIILLRSADNVIYGYKRERDKFSDKYRRREFKFCKSDEQWLKKAKEIGLYDDLIKFNELWEKNDSDKLIVYYDDLIKEPKKEINRIEEYLGLPVSNNVKLSRMRYTR
jgi:hypothetical protein